MRRVPRSWFGYPGVPPARHGGVAELLAFVSSDR